MARTHNPIWTGHQGVSGSIAKQIVFKQLNDKTFITSYPNMKDIIPTQKQRNKRSKFAEAVKFAQEIIRDPIKKAAYKTEKGKNVYQTAIRDYLNSR